MNRRSEIGILVAMLFAAAFVGPAAAQSGGANDAVMSASVYRPIPQGARVTLRLADDTDINLRLREVATRSLTRAGYHVVEDDPVIVLRLESRRFSSANSADRSIGQLRYGSGFGRSVGNVDGPQGVGVDVKLKLWSSTRNSLLKPQGKSVAQRQGFGVSIDAYDEIAGKPAWSGVARAADNGGDSFRAGGAMVRRLIEALGIAVEAETVSLR